MFFADTHSRARLTCGRTCWNSSSHGLYSLVGFSLAGIPASIPTDMQVACHELFTEETPLTQAPKALQANSFLPLLGVNQVAFLFSSVSHPSLQRPGHIACNPSPRMLWLGGIKSCFLYVLFFSSSFLQANRKLQREREKEWKLSVLVRAESRKLSVLLINNFFSSEVSFFSFILADWLSLPDCLFILFYPNPETFFQLRPKLLLQPEQSRTGLFK